MAEGQVTAVALKLPQFWANLPAHWFLHIESQFSTRNIVQEKTKYDYVIQSLSQDTISSVFDIMTEITSSQGTNEPINDPYSYIKKHLIERHTLSESRRIETLLSGMEMGDRTPSEFFRNLKNLAGSSDAVNDKLIISLWARRLPPMVQATLKAIPKAEITDQLTMADNVYEVYSQEQRSQPSINSLTRFEPSNDVISDILTQNKRLEKEMADLKGMIQRLSTSSRESDNKSRSRNVDRTRDRSRSRNNRSRDSGLCWYHENYGKKATKCRKPCSFGSTPN